MTVHDPKEFAKRCRLLKGLGVEYTRETEYRDQGSVELNLFKAVKLPLTPYEWCALCQNEGRYYLGGCCGSMSRLHDVVDGVFRIDSGFLPVRTLAEIADAIVAHGEVTSGYTFGDEHDPTKLVGKLKRALSRVEKDRAKGKTVIDPWAFMAVLWHVVKDFYAPDPPRMLVADSDKSDKAKLDDAISTLYHTFQRLTFEQFFGEPADKNDHATQRRAGRLVKLARMLPALKILNEQIDQLDPGDFDGFAVVAKAAPDEVLTNSYGYCVYESEAAAQKMLRLLLGEREEYEGEPARERKVDVDLLQIRPVTVNKSTGIAFKEG